MSNTKHGSGQCLCGKVKVRVNNINNKVGACHCSTCRKWAGGPFMTIDCGSDVSFGGDEYISVYNSSEWAERGFCKNCGSHLFYRLKANNLYIMPAGIFDNVENLIFDHQVFIDEKPGYYGFSNETYDMTGVEVFAKYSS